MRSANDDEEYGSATAVADGSLSTMPFTSKLDTMTALEPASSVLLAKAGRLASMVMLATAGGLISPLLLMAARIVSMTAGGIAVLLVFVAASELPVPAAKQIVHMPNSNCE